MFTAPSIGDVIREARALGFELEQEDARILRRHIVERLQLIDGFMRDSSDSARQGAGDPARGGGHFPTPEEDPLAAWLWCCEVKGADAGLLADKTVSFKDHIPVSGMPLTFGARALSDFVVDFDATVVQKVLDAGGTIVGKNALDCLTGGSGNPNRINDFRRTVNPHNHAHVPGGSSGGSAAAVAAGEVDISFGGDQLGSIRIPAAWCGCVGLKPTFGLVSHFGVGFGADASLDHVGPLTRTFEDAALALEAVAGYDPNDPRQGRDVPSHYDATSAIAEGVKGWRIGLVQEGFVGATPEVTHAVVAAVDVLRGEGALVRETSIPELSQARALLTALACEGARFLFDTSFLGIHSRMYYPESLLSAMDSFFQYRMDELLDERKLDLLAGGFSRRVFQGRAYARAANQQLILTRALDAVFGDFDVLAMPTMVRPALRYELAEDYHDNLSARLSGYGVGVEPWREQNTLPFNCTGHPAVAVPCGKVDGLPVSLQLVARRLGDADLLRCGFAYQHGVDWASMIKIG